MLEILQSNSCSPSFISVLQHYHDLFNKGFHISFFGVPAHLGIKGNEAHNKAANQECKPLTSLVPYSDFKLDVNFFIGQRWQREWDSLTENKLKEIKPCIVT